MIRGTEGTISLSLTITLIDMASNGICRQIRNAFQTAIALAEHESTLAQPGDPKPVLGKKQFEIVARGSRKFDEYLEATLGDTEADQARREGWRNDGYMVVRPSTMPVVAAAAPSRSSYSRYPKQTKASRKQEPVSSEEESKEESSSEESSSDDESTDQEKEKEREKEQEKEKDPPAKPSETPAGISFEQYQQFLQFQQMQAKN